VSKPLCMTTLTTPGESVAVYGVRSLEVDLTATRFPLQIIVSKATRISAILLLVDVEVLFCIDWGKERGQGIGASLRCWPPPSTFQFYTPATTHNGGYKGEHDLFLLPTHRFSSLSPRRLPSSFAPSVAERLWFFFTPCSAWCHFIHFTATLSSTHFLSVKEL